MTVQKIIAIIDTLRPNTASRETKVEWIDTLEKSIAEHMSRYAETKPETPKLEAESEVLLGSEYLYMYAYYGVAMIDLANQDIAMYNNSSAFFTDMFENWQKKWRREHLPSTLRGDE